MILSIINTLQQSDVKERKSGLLGWSFKMILRLRNSLRFYHDFS